MGVKAIEAKKKAQGLSLNTIVIAAIVLVVLVVVLALIFGVSNKTIPFFGSQANCQARGGECKLSSELCDGTKVTGLGGCDAAKPDCCIKRQQ